MAKSVRCITDVTRNDMHGLYMFISDIRKCKSKEEEFKRINKELSNITSTFRGNEIVDGYNKKKYLCKLTFIFLLGHNIDIGKIEAINLLSSNRYSEKQVGYLFISVVVNETTKFMQLILKCVKDDLLSPSKIYNNLALQYVANFASKSLADSIGTVVLNILFSPQTEDFVRQSAVLALMRLFPIKPEILSSDVDVVRIVNLLSAPNLGLVTAAVSLVEVLVKAKPNICENCTLLAVSLLSRLLASIPAEIPDYTYYLIPAPWLCIKLLRLLQNFPTPTEAATRALLHECMEKIMTEALTVPKSKKLEHSNAKHAVIFEAIFLIFYMEHDAKLLNKVCNNLSIFLNQKESNLRFLALEAMSLYSNCETLKHKLNKQLKKIANFMNNETDVCIQKNATELLYNLCDKSNVKEIVEELLYYLENVDYSVREETVLKIALLVEKFSTDFIWYFDAIINLIRISAEHVSEEVLSKLINTVIKQEEIQMHAAQSVFKELQTNSHCHETMVKLSAYILGEFGNLIESNEKSMPLMQLKLLHSRFSIFSVATRALLLTTYMKFLNRFPEIKADVQNIFRSENIIRSSNPEIQQRAVEYLKLSQIANADRLATIFKEIPPSESKTSITETLKRSKSFSIRKISPRKAVTSHTKPTKPMKSNDDEMPESDISANQLFFTSTSNVSLSSALCYTLIDQPLKTASVTEEVSHEKFLERLVYEERGTLYENDCLKVSIESKFHEYTGSIILTYKNKTNFKFEDFNVTIHSLDIQEKILVKLLPCRSIIEGYCSIQHTIRVMCLNDFTGCPNFVLRFNCANVHYQINWKLPLTLNKFLHPFALDAAGFFTRWKNLANPTLEVQKKYVAKNPMVREETSEKLKSFGLAVLDKIDSNHENLVCVGVVCSKSAQFGCLVRIERGIESGIYRMTIRSSSRNVSRELIELLRYLV